MADRLNNIILSNKILFQITAKNKISERRIIDDEIAFSFVIFALSMM